ncbi:MAG: hypothetical protein JXA08_07315 [Methanomicrobiaceae archaeon]|nr:hypothetical protein [Methanomicrobiaceae archaeon]
MRIDYERVMTAGFGVLILGVAWLVFWLGPAFPLYEGDVRWAHNFAFALIFIIVGLASWKRSVSSGIIAVIASFLMVPAELAFFSGETATGIAGVFFALMLAVIVIERQTGKDLVRPPPRLNAWLRIHLLTLAYIGIAHMPFISFLVRRYAADPFLLSLRRTRTLDVDLQRNARHPRHPRHHGTIRENHREIPGVPGRLLLGGADAPPPACIYWNLRRMITNVYIVFHTFPV